MLRNSCEIVIQLVGQNTSQRPSESSVAVGSFRAAHRSPNVAGGPVAVHGYNGKHPSIDAVYAGQGQPLHRLVRRQVGGPAVTFEIYKYDARSYNPGVIPREFVPPNGDRYVAIQSVEFPRHCPQDSGWRVPIELRQKFQ